MLEMTLCMFLGLMDELRVLNIVGFGTIMGFVFSWEAGCCSFLNVSQCVTMDDHQYLLEIPYRRTVSYLQIHVQFARRSEEVHPRLWLQLNF